MSKNNIYQGMIGKGGETAVISEMLFRQFNANILMVDYGADVLAYKNGKTFKIQVKTRHWNKKNRTMIYFREEQIKLLFKQGMYLIVVLRDREKETNDYMIFNNLQLQRFHKINLFDKRMQQKKIAYRMWFIRKHNKIYAKNLENDVTQFLNKWDLIRG